LFPAVAMKRGLLRVALVLGLIQAIGPFAIDMYLPALPSIGQGLDAGVDAVQASLTVFFIALAMGQLLYGPISDMVGRKLPLYFGLGLFAAASVGCALASDVQALIAFRFLQGLGACACFAVPRAIVRDLHTGVEAARLMSMLMLVFSVAPIVAPMAGSFVAEWVGWRGIFWSVAVLAVVGIGMTATLLAETRPPHKRVDTGFASLVAAYRLVLADGRFLAYVAVGAFGVASFHAYLAGSSFALIDHYGLSPKQYSIAFSMNAISFIGAAQLTGRLGARHGLRTVVKRAALGYAAAMLLLLGFYLAGVDRLEVLIVLLFIGYGFLGLVIPATSVLALDRHGANAGTASALIGTFQFVCGAVVIGVSGLFTDGTALPMVASIATCALASVTIAWLTLGTSGRLDATADRFAR
jgi:DHA1 family bicyclomycin/chloramphenicol resistance-like MFS transporter